MPRLIPHEYDDLDALYLVLFYACAHWCAPYDKATVPMPIKAAIEQTMHTKHTVTEQHTLSASQLRTFLHSLVPKVI